MKSIIGIIDSLFGATVMKNASLTPDPTMYQVETSNNTYSGYIVFQDDVMIKFRTTSLKPVKILKNNIVRVTIMSRYSSQYVTA